MAETRTRTDGSERSRATTRATRSRAGKASSPPGGDERARAKVCEVAFCPIGLALSGVQQAAPDAIDHLLAAARELFLAATAVMDARASDLGQKERAGLERIEIA